MPKPPLDLSFLKTPNPPYSPSTTRAALTLYMFYRKKNSITEKLVSEFQEDFLGTFGNLQDFAWKILNANSASQVQAIGIEIREANLQKISHNWFNTAEACSTAYVALQAWPDSARNLIHIFAKRQP